MTETMPVDPHNPHMMDATMLPVSWSMATASSPLGQRAFVCFRTPDVTLTLKMTRDDLERLAGDLMTTAQGFSGLIVPPSARYERPREICTGGARCEAPKHAHGCFADHGACDEPSAHK